MDWLERQLESNDLEKKFILSMHVFPGLNYYNGVIQQFWHSNYTERFL